MSLKVQKQCLDQCAKRTMLLEEAGIESRDHKTRIQASNQENHDLRQQLSSLISITKHLQLHVLKQNAQNQEIKVVSDSEDALQLLKHKQEQLTTARVNQDLQNQLGFKHKIAKNKDAAQQQQEAIETKLRESMLKRQRELDLELQEKQQKRKDLLEKIS